MTRDAEPRLSVNIGGLAAQVDRDMYDLLRLASHPVDAGSPDLILTRVDDLPEPAFDRTRHHDNLSLTTSSATGVFLLTDDLGPARALISHGRIEVVAPGLDPRLRLILWIALAYAFQLRDRPVLHAAGLTRDGTTVIALAASGTGKTTTTLAAHLGGWSVLSDDWATVHERDGVTWVNGVGRQLSVPPEVAPQGTVAMDGDPRGRHSYSIECEGGSFRLDGIVLLRHGDDGYVRESQDNERLRWQALLNSTYTAHDADALRHNMPLLADAARLPAWDLALTADPTTRLDHIATSLEEIHRSLAAG